MSFCLSPWAGSGCACGLRRCRQAGGVAGRQSRTYTPASPAKAGHNTLQSYCKYIKAQNKLGNIKHLPLMLANCLCGGPNAERLRLSATVPLGVVPLRERGLRTWCGRRSRAFRQGIAAADGRGLNGKEVSNGNLFVGILGLEPRMTGPESVVLPLHHIPILLSGLFPDCECKGSGFSRTDKTFSRFFSLKSLFFHRKRLLMGLFACFMALLIRIGYVLGLWAVRIVPLFRMLLVYVPVGFDCRLYGARFGVLPSVCRQGSAVNTTKGVLNVLALGVSIICVLIEVAGNGGI